MFYLGKCVVAVIITLKTARGTKTLRLAPQIHDQLVKENVAIGDVIYIESNTGMEYIFLLLENIIPNEFFLKKQLSNLGQVKRMGRCDIFATEFDLELEEYVPLPKGEVFKVKKIAQELSLHDLDTANAKPMVSSYNFLFDAKYVEIYIEIYNITKYLYRVGMTWYLSLDNTYGQKKQR